MKKETGNLNGDFIAMYTRVIYVGGAPKQNTVYRTIKKNFIGCLRNVSTKIILREKVVVKTHTILFKILWQYKMKTILAVSDTIDGRVRA